MNTSNPSSLRHYTKFDSLHYILNFSEENIVNGIPLIDLRLSYPLQCNDLMEEKFFTESLHTGSEVSNQLKSDIEEVKKEIGIPFIISLIHQKRAVMKDCPLSEIPMWNMYGGKNKGACLRFDYKLLKKYCENHEIMLFPIKYLNYTQMREETELIRKKMKKITEEKTRKSECLSIYKRAIQYKPLNWSYENEYRIAVWSNNYEIVDSKFYFHIKVPLYCLKEIIIGSSADFDECKNTIETIKKDFEERGVLAEFKVSKSKILMRL